MKKLKILMALMLMLVILGSGCTNSRGTTTVTETAQSSTEETTQAPFLPEEKTQEEVQSLLKDDEDYDISDELREAMDLYEDFVDEYCDFMVTYMNADQNWQLNNMERYMKYTQGITDCQEAINEVLERKDELTKDEYEYIVVVQTRTAQKLLKTATEGLDGKQKSN